MEEIVTKKYLSILSGVIMYCAFIPQAQAQYQDHFRIQQEEFTRRMEEERQRREMIEAQRQQNRRLEEIQRQLQLQNQQRQQTLPRNVPSWR